MYLCLTPHSPFHPFFLWLGTFFYRDNFRKNFLKEPIEQNEGPWWNLLSTSHDLVLGWYIIIAPFMKIINY